LVYTQAPVLNDAEIESMLKESQVARFCSLNKDGTIHATPIWYKYEHGEIIIMTPVVSRKARNVMRNRNVTILIDREAPPSRGVIIYGRAELNSDFDLDEAISLNEKYMPKEEARKLTIGLAKLSKWAKVKVKPESIASFDYAKDRAFETASQG